MMRWPGFVGPTYTLKSPAQDAQRCVNMFPEIHELGGTKQGEIGYLISTPGLRRLATIGTGPIRGTYQTSTGRLAVVSGSELYRVDSTWTATKVGDLMTNTGMVDMTDNGQDLLVVDGPNGYAVSLVTGVFQRIVGEAFYGADRCGFLDGYFVLNNPGTSQFYLSDLYKATSYDGLDFGNAEGNPDAVVAVLVDRRQVWLLGAKTMEVWWNTGAEFPLSRIDGSFAEVGCASAHAARKFAGTVAWLTDQGQVVVADGYQPRRISNFAVEDAIQQGGDLSKAYAWTYQDGGHIFYALQLETGSSTWVYDSSTGQWHERTFTTGGQQTLHRGACHEWAFETHVIGDREDGRIYAFEDGQRTDDGAVITQERIPPRLSSPSLERAFVSELVIDMETGIGLDGTGQGTDPQAMLRSSRDGGRTWGSERWVSLGAIGNRRVRAIWRRFGQARDLGVWFRVTDPVRLVINGAEIKVQQGTS